MLVTRIPETLNVIYSTESKTRSIIFDGKWGCGKTFNIHCFLNSDAKPNSIYVSLFGVRSATDIILRLAEKLDSRFINNVGGNYNISSSSYYKPYNRCLIVFDDLERKADELPYESFFAIIDSLCRLGFKTVCAVNSESIEDKAGYRKFVEKTFDSVVYVSADPSVFSKVMPGFEFEADDSYLSYADGNWRILIKARNACNDILSFMEKNNKNDFISRMRLDNSSFFRCVLLAVKCIFSKNEEKPEFGKADDFKKLFYEGDVFEYGEFVANELHKMFSLGGEANGELKSQVKLLIKCISEYNYQSIIDKYYPNHNNGILSESPFDNEPFFLDDDGKKDFKETFFKRLSDFNFGEELQERLLVRVISVFIESMSEKEICLLINRIVETVPLENSDSFMRMLFLDDDYKLEKLNRLKSSLHNKFSELKDVAKNNQLEEAFETENYSFLTDFLYKNNYADASSKEIIVAKFLSHGFYLPDLSRTITYECWQYCHEIARFIAGIEKYRDAFIEALRSQCEKSNSKSLRERCNALVKGYFSVGMDFFKLYPLS